MGKGATEAIQRQHAVGEEEHQRPHQGGGAAGGEGGVPGTGGHPGHADDHQHVAEDGDLHLPELAPQQAEHHAGHQQQQQAIHQVQHQRPLGEANDVAEVRDKKCRQPLDEAVARQHQQHVAGQRQAETKQDPGMGAVVVIALIAERQRYDEQHSQRLADVELTGV